MRRHDRSPLSVSWRTSVVETASARATSSVASRDGVDEPLSTSIQPLDSRLIQTFHARAKRASRWSLLLRATSARTVSGTLNPLPTTLTRMF